MRAAQPRWLEHDVGADLTWMPMYKPRWSNSNKSSLIKPLSLKALQRVSSKCGCSAHEECLFFPNLHSYMKYMLKQIKASSLFYKILFVLNAAATVHFPVAVWAIGRKVSEATGRVASEKEQQHSRPLEMRQVSMIEWNYTDRVPKVKDRGIWNPSIRVVSAPAASDSSGPLLAVKRVRSE